MVADLRKCLALIPPSMRWRWAGLVPFMVLAAMMEAVGAGAVFGLIKIISEPRSVSDMWITAAVSRWLPWRDEFGVVVSFTVLVAMFYVLKNGLLALVNYIQTKVISDSKAALSRRMLKGYLTLPYAFHLRRNSAELIRNATDSVDSALGSFIAGALGLITEAMVVMGIVAILITMSPVVTLVAVSVLFALLAVLLRTTRRAATRWGALEQELRKTALQSLQQCLGAIKEVKVSGHEQFFYDSFSSLQGGLIRVHHLYELLSALPRLLVETVFVCGLLLVIMLVTATDGAGQDAIALLGLYAYGGFRIIPSLNRILMRVNFIRRGRAAADQLHRDWALFESDPAGGFGASEVGEISFARTIALEGVSYTYDGSDAPVLHDISLEIRRGESVGIVGPTGAGKSMLINLILGLLQPTGGRILVDGRNIGNHLRSWQSKIGYVPQEICLIDDSMRRNIAFGVSGEDIDEQKVQAALRMAQLNGFVAGLPRGLDTSLGERGLRLSGGERQRVAIARALYHEPELVVFDEATSALDPQTEHELVGAIEAIRGEKTVLIIAHRLSTVQDCDRLVFLRDGRVEGWGTFEEILQSNQEFRKMLSQNPSR
jgi:ATP-binding cassette, subfamily B, bacterial PglK